MQLDPVHLAFQVRDIAEARAFYGGLLGCKEVRSAETWVDFNFFGHQMTDHLMPSTRSAQFSDLNISQHIILRSDG